MTASTDRQTFRETVALVAAKAKAKLPEAVNGRIEKAVKLVLAGDIFPQPDGSILVGSSSDPMQSYTLTGQTCECRDFVYGKEIEGWCAHRIAAGIQKRVGELLPAQPEVVEPWPDTDVEDAPAPPSPPVETETVPQFLPEAPASVNVRLLIDGRDCQLTLRDHDEGRLLERLAVVLKQYPNSPERFEKKAIKTAGETTDTGEAPQCPTHGQMKASTKGTGWYCPTKLSDDTWCKSKGR
jgi:hypothetical protein